MNLIGAQELIHLQKRLSAHANPGADLALAKLFQCGLVILSSDFGVGVDLQLLEHEACGKISAAIQRAEVHLLSSKINNRANIFAS